MILLSIYVAYAFSQLKKLCVLRICELLRVREEKKKKRRDSPNNFHPRERPLTPPDGRSDCFILPLEIFFSTPKKILDEIFTE